MTKIKHTNNNKQNSPKDKTMELMIVINKKLDYLITLTTDEEYKYPYHKAYMAMTLDKTKKTK